MKDETMKYGIYDPNTYTSTGGEMKFNPEIISSYGSWTEKRRKQTIAFIRKNVVEFKKDSVLCIGSDNDFDKSICKDLKLKPSFSRGNLDYFWWDRGNYFFYYYIFCFEVIEHLLNPLLFLERIKEVINEDSLLFITYPINRSWLMGKTHFNEYRKDRFEYLVDKAGFRIIDYQQKMYMKSIFQAYKGIRPLLRATPIGWCKRQFYCIGLKGEK